MSEMSFTVYLEQLSLHSSPLGSDETGLAAMELSLHSSPLGELSLELSTLSRQTKLPLPQQ